MNARCVIFAQLMEPLILFCYPGTQFTKYLTAYHTTILSSLYFQLTIVTYVLRFILGRSQANLKQ